MKKLLIIFTIITAFSCSNQQSNMVHIKGKVHSENVKNVKISWLRDNPISGLGNDFIASVDSNSEFTFEIPISGLATGGINAGRFRHDISLLPGDKLYIDIDGDTISYQGKGSGKNNFLYHLEKDGLQNRKYYEEFNNGKLDLPDFAEHMVNFRDKRLNFLELHQKEFKLDEEFVRYFETENQVIYERQIQNYPKYYAYRKYRNKVSVDSLDLPVEYLRMNQIKNIMADEKVMFFNYIHNMRNLIYTKAREIVKADSTKNFSDAKYVVLFDSLQGKTREYVLAKWICTEYSRDKYDTLAYDKFLEIATDEMPIQTVEAAKNKYFEKRALIGQALKEEFAQTILEDTSKTEISFGEMMDKHQGKVVYLDIWGLGCGPCRVAMHYSRMLKEKLAGLPVDFIYLTTDRYNKKLWQDVFELTMTRENHYRLKNGFNAQFLKYMEINWVPCYMIFDREGKLYDFNADRPTRMVEKHETDLERTLRQLTVLQIN